jgi:L-ascorbate metabolism protein UlaG (beta-lactamase superfamily)
MHWQLCDSGGPGIQSRLPCKARHFLVPLGLAAHLKYWGVANDKIDEFHWHDNQQLRGINFSGNGERH